MRKIHLTNAANRNATLKMAALRPAPAPRPGLPGQTVEFKRYLAATEPTLARLTEPKLGRRLRPGAD